MASDMSAEQAPLNKAAQQEPQVNNLRLATAGVFAGENTPPSSFDTLTPNQYDARLGGTAAGQPPFTPGSFPERTPTPGKGNNLRNVLIAGGAILGGAATVAGTLFGIDRLRSDSDTGSTETTAAQTVEIPTVIPPTPTPEATPTPEIKSTPYNFINQRVYLDGKLTLEITDGMPTRTTVPKSIMPGIYEGQTAEGFASSGFEINPEWPNAAKDIVDLINYGLLSAWSAQSDIPDSQKDLITNINESREVQMAKWDRLKARAAKGEHFNVTLMAYKNGGFVSEEVPINIGDDWKYKIDELEKPPIQIKWQSNMGTGIRISPENKEFRIELFDQYAGAISLFSEKTFLSGNIIQTLAYLPELVGASDKQITSDLYRPSLAYQVNTLRNNSLILATKYNIIPDAYPGTYGKDWKDSAIHPLP